MERVLLTGGAGFIGSHLAERLILREHPLFIVDDLNDFYSIQTKKRNLEEIRQRGPYEFELADICDEEKLKGSSYGIALKSLSTWLLAPE